MRSILHLTRDFPPRVKGGISIAVGEWASAQARAGHNVTVVSFDAWRPQASSPTNRLPVIECTVNGIGVMRLSGPDDLGAARAFVKEQSPQLVHVHHGMLWDFARDLNLPTAFHIHVLQQRLNELRGVEDTLSQRAQAQAIKEADVVLCPSHSVATEIAGIRPDASVVGQGIRVTAPSPVRDPCVSTVSYIGRFADIKGTSEFIRALAIVADERPSLRIVMAGGLPDNPKSEKRWRARILEALPNAELPGWLAPSDLERVYQESHIVVVPSWHETFGLVALEAMAHGAAVVASACGGLSELIAHNESGLLVPPQDCKALTRAVLELLNKPSWAEQLGQNAAMSVAARYKWPERIRALDRIYDGLIIFRKKVGRDRGKLKGA